MTPAQARALLALIADLYLVANQPEPQTNHKVETPIKEPAKTK